MSTTFCMPAPGQGKLEQSSVTGLLAVAKRWGVAYITRRIAAAIAHLRAMSDRELDDFLPRQASPMSLDRWTRRRPHSTT
jgi:hypothetical protein